MDKTIAADVDALLLDILERTVTVKHVETKEYPYFQSLLFDMNANMTDDQYNILLNKLNKCKCCYRHTGRTDAPFKPKLDFHTSGCECCCRHMKRLFYRTN